MVSLIILLIISSIISPLIILWVITLIPSVGLNFKKIISELFRLMTSVSNLSSLFLLIPLTIQGFLLELPLLLVVIRVLPNVSAGQSLGLIVSDCFKFPGPARASESSAARLAHGCHWQRRPGPPADIMWLRLRESHLQWPHRQGLPGARSLAQEGLLDCVPSSSSPSLCCQCHYCSLLRLFIWKPDLDPGALGQFQGFGNSQR